MTFRLARRSVAVGPVAVGTLACCAAIAASGWAAVPTTLPATYLLRETDRLTVTVTAAGRSVTRRDRLTDDARLVLDVGAFRLEQIDGADAPIEGSWRTTGRNTARFSLSDTSRAAIEADAQREFEAAGLTGRTNIRFGVGHLRFSRSATAVTGSETVHMTMRGRSKGRWFTAVARIDMSWKTVAL